MKIQKLSTEEILNKIDNEIFLEAVQEDYSFMIKIRDYSSYICTAVHDGHNFRKSLWANCTHSGYERWYEEDPSTFKMIRSHPVVISGLDSRFEYDLNRDPENAIYEDAWGKRLWRNPLSEKERNISLQKHRSFYRVLHALVDKMHRKQGRVIVFDMHSYNWRRWDREVPIWNIGTKNIDIGRFGGIAESWRYKLSTMILPGNIKSTSKINDTFEGNGFVLKYITQNFEHALVLATEIAKVYCDEETGVVFPEVVHAVEEQLKELMLMQAAEFKNLSYDSR